MATIHRALVALDACGIPRILATDSSSIAFDCEEVSTDCEGVGMLRAKDIGEGLWLWEGEIIPHSGGHSGDDYDPEYKGSVRQVTGMAEAAQLFAMHAPEPQYDDRDRDSPGV